jgi:activator of HSP90 ATPase
MPTNITQKVTLNARPGKVYNALMVSREHTKFSGVPAKISTNVGGAGSAYGGHISTVNLVLKPGKCIVQAWRAGDWPADKWSVVTYRLKAKKGGKTALSFSQTGVPAQKHGAIGKGWKAFYWGPLNKYFKA